MTRLFLFTAFLMLAAERGACCSCGGSFHGSNPWEMAKLQTDAATVVFEGTPEFFDLQWPLFSGKEGEWIPVDSPSENAPMYPHMVIRFRVQRIYKGSVGQEVVLTTGLGGGDCGARFMTGLTYLLYLFGKTPKEYYVGLCSPGGWIGDTGSDLRYLRNEAPREEDFLPIRWWDQQHESAKNEQLRKNRLQEIHRQYAAATGSICGKVVRENPDDGSPGRILFLSTSGYSPFQYPEADVKSDGSFCSARLGPGKYYLYLQRLSDDHDSLALFYPGTTDKTHAIPIDVRGGENQSNFTFTVPKLDGYSVFGYVSVDDKAQLGDNPVYVGLVNTDVDLPAEYIQPVYFRGALPLPRGRFFRLKNVAPGTYLLLASAVGNGWITKKLVVRVTNHPQFISVAMMHRK